MRLMVGHGVGADGGCGGVDGDVLGVSSWAQVVDVECWPRPGKVLEHLASDGSFEDPQDLGVRPATVTLTLDELSGSWVAAHADHGDGV